MEARFRIRLEDTITSQTRQITKDVDSRLEKDNEALTLDHDLGIEFVTTGNTMRPR